MKKPRQVWPLLKQMLGIYRFGPLRFYILWRRAPWRWWPVRSIVFRLRG